MSQAVQTYFGNLHDTEEIATEARKRSTHETAHGRIETRHYYHAPIPKKLQQRQPTPSPPAHAD